MKEYVFSYDIVKKLLRLDSIAVAVVVFFVLFLQEKKMGREKNTKKAKSHRMTNGCDHGKPDSLSLSFCTLTVFDTFFIQLLLEQ